MTATFIQDGSTIDFIPATDTPAGTVVVQADLIGITARAIGAGQLGALRLTGVFDVPRLTGGVIGTGFRLYWDTVQGRAHTDAASGMFLGHAVRESGDTDPTVRVRLG